MANIIEGKVVMVKDNFTVVINKGKLDGVKENSRFLIYKLGNELFDPDTKKSLGVLELVCGEGVPTHIQDNVTTIRSIKKITRTGKIVKKSSPYGSLFGEREEISYPESEDCPFDDVDVGCLVRQI